MKMLIYTAALLLAVIFSIPVVATTEPHCMGDAAHPTPPVVNNPMHIRNVVWKNMRAMCLQEIAQPTPANPALSKPPKTVPTVVPVQPQKRD